ncbi:hypothetical protein [Paludisphaera rhizosphaerae]|uniref:hypothetical protein n=1 Tax=Paludisphaera rhizosphaerae TaxID=2711216 RepID=UPI0013EDEDD6|nr:hypothetical protein [Paludisphaera rhizosphaerae]
MNPTSHESGDLPEARQSLENRSLGRLRLDAEPLEVQLARHRAAFHVLAGVTTAIAAAFFALFAAFDRPGVGLVVGALLWLPIVGVSWRDHRRLARAVEHQLQERARLDRDQNP